MVKSNVVKFAVMAMTLMACESKVEEEKHVGTAVSECPTGTAAGGGSGGASTTDTSVPPCVADEDCPVPANCVLCPGSDVCTSPTATCIEGTCQINSPVCPSAGGGGQGGSASAGGAGGTASVGGSSQGGAAAGGASGGGMAPGGSGGAGGTP